MDETMLTGHTDTARERKPWCEPELVEVPVVNGTGNGGTPPADDGFGT